MRDEVKRSTSCIKDKEQRGTSCMKDELKRSTSCINDKYVLLVGGMKLKEVPLV